MLPRAATLGIAILTMIERPTAAFAATEAQCRGQEDGELSNPIHGFGICQCRVGPR